MSEVARAPRGKITFGVINLGFRVRKATKNRPLGNVFTDILFSISVSKSFCCVGGRACAHMDAFEHEMGQLERGRERGIMNAA